MSSSNTNTVSRHHKATALSVGAAALALVAGACGSPSTGAQASGTTSSTSKTPSSASSTTATTVVYNTTSVCKAGAKQITFWDWIPGISKEVTQFNRTHPTICVKLDNVGAGTTEYNKLLLDIRAHKGLPDVAEVEYSALPEFEITHSLDNLAKYGANSVKSKFAPAFWSMVTHGSGVYAIPGDTGPLGLLVNTAFMKKYGLSVPTTWKQLATEAKQLHKAHPGVYLTDFSPKGGEGYIGLMAQAGAHPFSWSGTHATFNYTSAAGLKVANYWQGLIGAHAVDNLIFLSTQWDKALSSGKIGLVVSPAWMPGYFAASAAKSTIGQWRAEPLPQWTAGANVTANWGGSSYPVFSTSKHPRAATTFAIWMNATMASWRGMIGQPSALFPSFLPMLNSSLLGSKTIPLTGSQKYYKPFIASAKRVPSGFTWDPFEIYERTQMDNDFASVISGKTTLPAALRTLRSQMISYAKTQGFSASK